MTSDTSWLLKIPPEQLNALLASARLDWIALVSEDAATSLVQDPHSWSKDEFEKKYLFWDSIDGRWVAIDNTSGDCFIEEFFEWEHAVMWLKDESLGPVEAETIRKKEAKGKESQNGRAE